MMTKPHLLAENAFSGGAGLRDLTHSKQRIVVGDCLEVLSKIPERSFDVIVTSPPYNIGVSYRSHQDNMPSALFLSWMSEVAKALRRVLKDEGSLFLNADGCARHPWRGYEAGKVFSEQFCLQNEITWVKAITIGDQSRGHFKPILPLHEGREQQNRSARHWRAVCRQDEHQALEDSAR
jgi:site-specific DNA-methyltransferase (adenine-specific)